MRTISNPALTLIGILVAVVVIFLATGAVLAALPVHIHQGLGLDAFVVGLVAGAQFAASLLSRLWAGSFSDRHGSKGAVVIGLLMAVIGAGAYLGSVLFTTQPVVSVAVLLVGRAIMGGAESFVITGAVSWALSITAPKDAAKIIGWTGTAMFAALAAGAPLGSLLFEGVGFWAIGVLTLGLSVVSLLVVAPMGDVRPERTVSSPWSSVLRAVWLPGLAISGASLAFGAMTTFAVLLFVQRGWEPAWLSFTLFAAGLIIARTVFGGVPDRFGGATTAMIFVIIQGAGMALIWLSPNAVLAFVGAAVTGLGYSFVYPGLGREAVRRAPASATASAMAAYTAFIDVALGILTPLLGLLAAVSDLGTVFAVSAALALGTAPIAAYLRRTGGDRGTG